MLAGLDRFERHLRLQADAAVDRRIHEHLVDPGGGQCRHGLHGCATLGPDVLELARELAAGVRDVSRLLDDMDRRELAHERLHLVVTHDLALRGIEELFDDERPDERHDLCAEDLGVPDELAQRGLEAVDRRPHLLDHPGEHQRVPALVLDLGERVAHVVGDGAPHEGVAQQERVELHLEGDAGRQPACRLVLGQLDALLERHAVPQRRAIQGHVLLRDEELAGFEIQRPVDVDVGVVGLVRRRLEQPGRDLLAAIAPLDLFRRQRHGRHVTIVPMCNGTLSTTAWG